jgi:hypothetical protein
MNETIMNEVKKKPSLEQLNQKLLTSKQIDQEPLKTSIKNDDDLQTILPQKNEPVSDLNYNENTNTIITTNNITYNDSNDYINNKLSTKEPNQVGMQSFNNETCEQKKESDTSCFNSNNYSSNCSLNAGLCTTTSSSTTVISNPLSPMSSSSSSSLSLSVDVHTANSNFLSNHNFIYNLSNENQSQADSNYTCLWSTNNHHANNLYFNNNCSFHIENSNNNKCSTNFHTKQDVSVGTELTISRDLRC